MLFFSVLVVTADGRRYRPLERRDSWWRSRAE